MSTATTSRPVGDNEFPVLLRLPDLNATAWLPLPTPAAPAVTAGATVVTPVVAPVASPVPAASMASEAVPVPSMWTAPVELPSLPASSVAATTSIDVAPPVVTPETAPATSSTTAAPTARLPRTPRIERATPAQWTLIRQLATGGVLVGGLALTYFMIMGGGGDETPEHVATAETTLEPPLIETPTNVVAVNADTSVKVLKPDTESPADSIRQVPPPPDFGSKFGVSPEMPSHIVVAPPAETSKPVSPAPQAREDVGQYKGRIGPDITSARPAEYPTTDPSTFIYRPVPGEPTSEAARTARLNGTIAPPPLR